MMMDGGQRFPAGEGRQRSILERVIGAALLKREVYEEVEADTSATPTAAAIVVLSSIAGGIGGLGTTGAAGLVAGVVIGLAGWAAWALITYFIGTRMLPGPETRADWGQLARTLGFARAPALLLVFAAVPGIGAAGNLIATIVFFWGLAAMVVAVRAALDYDSTWRAVGVVLIGLIPIAIFSLIVLSITAAIFGAETVGLTPIATPEAMEEAATPAVTGGA